MYLKTYSVYLPVLELSSARYIETEIQLQIVTLFPAGPVIKCFVIPPNKNIHLLDAGWRTNYPKFQLKERDLIPRESKVQVVVSLWS